MCFLNEVIYITEIHFGQTTPTNTATIETAKKLLEVVETKGDSVVKSTPRKCAQNDSTKLSENQLNPKVDRIATGASNSNEIVSTNENIESDPVVPTSSQTTNDDENQHVGARNVVILLTPIPYVAPENPKTGQKKCDDKESPISTPKNGKRLTKTKVSNDFFSVM